MKIEFEVKLNRVEAKVEAKAEIKRETILNAIESKKAKIVAFGMQFEFGMQTDGHQYGG